MQTYARIVSGIVVEVIEPMTDSGGNEIPIASRYTPTFVDELVDITSVSPQPEQWWTANETSGSWEFAIPTPPSAP